MNYIIKLITVVFFIGLGIYYFITAMGVLNQLESVEELTPFALLSYITGVLFTVGTIIFAITAIVTDGFKDDDKEDKGNTKNRNTYKFD